MVKLLTGHAIVLLMLSLMVSLTACKNHKRENEVSISAGSPSLNTNTCNIKLAGAQTGTFSCGAQESPIDGPLVTYDQEKAVTDVNLAFNAPGDTPDFRCGLRFNGKPVVGVTYSLTSAGAGGSSATVHRNDQAWMTTQQAAAGSLTVTFTALDGASTLAKNTVWKTMHGTITAILPASRGEATGIVSVTATF